MAERACLESHVKGALGHRRSAVGQHRALIADRRKLHALEQHLNRPLHRARSARSDDRVAAVDVRRRADLTEDAAARARAEERAEVHAIGDVEDFPSRLQPRVAAAA